MLLHTATKIIFNNVFLFLRLVTQHEANKLSLLLGALKRVISAMPLASQAALKRVISAMSLASQARVFAYLNLPRAREYYDYESHVIEWRFVTHQ